MDINDIPKILSDFQKSDYSRTILITGCWGCGKTYQIKKFMDGNPNKEQIHYISLFGLSSADEINTILIQKLHPTLDVIGRSAGMLSKVVDPFLKVDIVQQSSEVIQKISIQLTDKTAKDCIIILDDLERMAAGYCYYDLLGYIDNLLQKGCKIICVADDKKIETSESFLEMREKIFDRVYSVQGASVQVLDEIFKGIEINNKQMLYQLVDGNLRIAQKGRVLYDEIIAQILPEDENAELTGFSEELLLKACILAVRICLETFPESEEVDELYTIIETDYGEQVKRGIQFFCSDGKSLSDYVLQQYLDFVLYYYQTGSLEKWNKLFAIDADSHTPEILKEEYYYLSDEEKEAYLQTAKDVLNSGLFEWTACSKRWIANIISYTNYDFSDKEISNIADKVKNEQEDYHSLLVSLGGISENKDKRNRARLVGKRIIDALQSQKYDETFDSLKDAYQKESYETIDEIVSNRNCRIDDELLRKWLAENNFFMPDLSGRITHEKWNLAHDIAREAARLGLKDAFVDFARKQCSGDEKSIKERYAQLLKQYFNVK